MRAPAEQIEREHRAAQDAMREGRLRDAHQHCLTVLKADRGHADAWFLCGVIAASNGQHAKAADILHNAIALAPQAAQYHAELGKVLLALRRTGEAMESAKTALRLNPTDVPTLNTLGTLYSHGGYHDQALACFDRAVNALGTGDRALRFRAAFRAEIFYNRGISRQFSGWFDQAESDYECAISIDPTLYSAHSALAMLKRQTPRSNHLERLESLRRGVNTSSDQLHLGHAIAKEREDLGDYTGALESLAWAKDAKSREVQYDARSDAALFDAIKRLYPAPSKSRSPTESGCASNEPIFIVGMPRTGTTLVEQILGSHSAVHAAGELNNFPQLVKKFSASNTGDDLDIPTLERAVAIDMEELGRSYIQSTRPATGHTSRFTDKLPLNFLYAGLIHRALPGAKIVCLRRDPMDTCLSNYRQLFAVNFRYYFYNLDLMDCGRYYIQFDQLMAHWNCVMPGAVFELSYEHLVDRPEVTARQLLEFCELPWEDQCLEFHQRDGSVATPSSVQVRQDIYSTSVGRWRRYGEAMQPLYDYLVASGCYD